MPGQDTARSSPPGLLTMATSDTPDPEERRLDLLRVQLDWLARHDRPEYFRRLQDAEFTIAHMETIMDRADLLVMKDQVAKGEDATVGDQAEEFLKQLGEEVNGC